MFRGGHEQWDGVIAELHKPAVIGTGYAERCVADERMILGYAETDEVIQVPITEGAKYREKTSLKKVVVYQHVHTKPYPDWLLPDVEDGPEH